MSAATFRIVPGRGISKTVSVRDRFRIVKVAATASDDKKLEGVPTQLKGQTLGDNLLVELDYIDQTVAVYNSMRVREQMPCVVRVFSLRGRFGDDHKALAERIEGMPKIKNEVFEQVLETGRKGDFFFVAYEALDGETLGEKVERDGGLPPELALDYLESVANGLTALHSRGHIHGDLSPDCLFLCKNGALKIIGMNRTRPSSDALTLGGEVLGNADYLAPERIDGRHLDPASDIYALGHTFYTLLAGRAPFSGNSPMATMICQLNQEPPSLARMATGIGAGQLKVFEKMTGKTFDQRYKDAHQLLADVRLIKAGRDNRIDVYAKPEKAQGLAISMVKTSLTGAIIVLAICGILQLVSMGIWLFAPVESTAETGVLPIVPKALPQDIEAEARAVMKSVSDK